MLNPSHLRCTVGPGTSSKAFLSLGFIICGMEVMSPPRGLQGGLTEISDQSVCCGIHDCHLFHCLPCSLSRLVSLEGPEGSKLSSVRKVPASTWGFMKLALPIASCFHFQGVGHVYCTPCLVDVCAPLITMICPVQVLWGRATVQVSASLRGL